MLRSRERGVVDRHIRNFEENDSKLHRQQNAHEGDAKFYLLHAAEPYPVARTFSRTEHSYIEETF